MAAAEATSAGMSKLTITKVRRIVEIITFSLKVKEKTRDRGAEGRGGEERKTQMKYQSLTAIITDVHLPNSIGGAPKKAFTWKPG